VRWPCCAISYSVLQAAERILPEPSIMQEQSQNVMMLPRLEYTAEECIGGMGKALVYKSAFIEAQRCSV
jgi:hypothetical protein